MLIRRPSPFDALSAILFIERNRPCLDTETTDADLAEWCRTAIIPKLDELGLL